MTRNLLFITIDDFLALSAWPLYDGIVQTPHLDQFMQDNTAFDAAFADVALCNPSRTAILTGRTPWDTGVLTNTQNMAHHVDLASQTLPGILKGAGFHTAVGGKVFHDLPLSVQDQVADELLDSSGLRNSSDPSFDSVSTVSFGTTDEILSDDILAQSTARFLDRYDGDAPFALFAGIYRPHTDWIIPQEYLDLYANIDIPIPDFVDAEDRAEFGAALGYGFFHDTVLAQEDWEPLIRHYLASMSYADAKLGEMLDALEASGQADNTVTMIMSDHGYHLGDAGNWHKFTTYEQSSRAPLAISVPGQDAQQVNVPVNLSGVAATALDLLGLDVPSDMQPSLVPLMTGAVPTGDEYAVTWMNASVSVRTADYRYTLYETGEEELFDINTDIMNTRNRIDERPAVAASLRAIAADEIGDTLFLLPDAMVTGTNGDDSYYFGATAADISDPGGNDTVYIDSDYTLPEDIENVHANSVRTGLVLTGNAASNIISGAAGNDVLNGAGGHDRIYGGAGQDQIFGGVGDDWLSGGTSADTIQGGAGDDLIDGGFGDDMLNGGDGNDEIYAAQGRDNLIGGRGNDVLDGGGGNDTLTGGSGNDILTGGTGWDQVYGGAGLDTGVLAGHSRSYTLVFSVSTSNFAVFGPDDRVAFVNVERLQFDNQTLAISDFFGLASVRTYTGTSGDDTLRGAGANDTLRGADGNDWIRGYGGDDLIEGGLGNDQIDGGFGFDTLSYASAGSAIEAYLNFSLSRGGDGKDSFLNIEAIVGSAFDDRIVGNAQDNTLAGGDGNDIVKGNAGADILRGGAGQDRIYGGAQDDVVEGDEGNDLLWGYTGADVILGGGGDDQIWGDSDADSLYGGDGNDRVFGGSGADLLSGNAGDDILFGQGDNDVLRGGQGNDVVAGGVGDDYVQGGVGQDRIFGDSGNDTLFGGRWGQRDGEADTFVYASTAAGSGGFDRIRDWENGVDVLDVTAFQFTDFTTDILARTESRNAGADLVIRFGQGDALYIDNFTLAAFDASDVLL